MKKKAEKPIRKRRPFGIWALTVFAVLVAGVLPILSLIDLFLYPTIEVVSIFIVAYLVIISTGVIITSVGAWLGRNWARKILWIFVALFFAPQIIFAIPEESFRDLIPQILQPVVTVAIYIWYFNRAQIKDFYGVGTDEDS